MVRNNVYHEIKQGGCGAPPGKESNGSGGYDRRLSCEEEQRKTKDCEVKSNAKTDSKISAKAGVRKV